MRKLLDQIIGHLGAAQTQRSPTDDQIIAGHIDEALVAAKELHKLIVMATRSAIP